jgi:4-amino-4-deoxy-L-arabinose transferase-like glycosyltransferase
VFGKSHRYEFAWLVVLGLWLLGAGVDRLWITLDHRVPSWDPADNLTNSLNFWWMLQQPHGFSGTWWTEFWQRSSKYPPLLFATTALLQNWVGRGADQALLVNLGFSAILLISVYKLGKHLFSPLVGLWAAGLCLLLPRLYTNRIQYFMDFPLTAIVAASFCLLTFWRDEKARSRQWFWALSFGCCFGLAVLTKQSALFFLVVPLLWVSLRALQQRNWERVLQLISGSLLTLAIALPWVCTNWIFQISAGFNSNVKSAANEGDPALNTWQAWAYYWNDLPDAISLPLLVVPLVGIVLHWLGRLEPRTDLKQERAALGWLAVFWVGSYLLWSAIVNKDLRYIMPYLPIVAIGLAYGLTRWSYRWQLVPWGTVILATLLMLLNLFPIGDSAGDLLTKAFSPRARSLPFLEAASTHAEIMDEVIGAQPYQLANIGMLASTPEVNQHTFNYYGNLRDFQVYSRQMGRESEQVEEDVRSLSWFIALQERRKSQQDSQQDDEDDPRSKTIRAIEQNPDFRLHKTWILSNKSRINLYHRPVMSVEVQPLTASSSSKTLSNAVSNTIRLDRLTLPDRSPPGEPIPITYEWSGSWEQLHSGLVLLTWRQGEDAKHHVWTHDHQIGLGTLYLDPVQPAADLTLPFKVIERTAALVPQVAIAGTYTLEATYLNLQTGETYAIAVPPVSITLDRTAAQLPAPELDWATQFQELSKLLPEGLPRLDRVFSKVAQLNMYDPLQSYTLQVEKILEYRQQEEPRNRDYAYGLALARALQQKVEPTIAALKQVVQLDSQNSNAYAYLAAVNLYALRPGAAQAALQSALAIAPQSPELHALSAIAALMQGNLWQAWQHYSQASL